TRLTVFRMLFAVFFGYLAHDFFSTPYCFIRRRKRCIFRQPHIELRKIRKVFREEIRFEPAASQSAGRQQNERAKQHLPTIIDGPVADSVIKSWEPFLAPFLDGWFKLWPQQEITDERNECHCHDQRGDQ